MPARQYDRAKAIAYAHRWAYGRNPAYYDFSALGGDCTNFISQCLRAGGAPMNYTPVTGWFYNSAASRAPAWTGVEQLYRFLTGNKGAGPYALPGAPGDIRPGDIVQLSFDAARFSHSLLVVEVNEGPSPESPEILVATHSDDSDYRPLDSWVGVTRRFLHIAGVR
ncbi:MAG TPA: amidase domain-containing protein [Firmicutes bacterium]|nr:amidase domain-containing protein [Bacillota bacterium]